jgi:hypothetical protein
MLGFKDEFIHLHIHLFIDAECDIYNTRARARLVSFCVKGACCFSKTVRK